MARAGAVLVENGKVALIERLRSGRTYYVFPGGKVEDGEWPAEAATREVLEELGLVIEIQRLLAEVDYNHRLQYYFLAERLGGEFGTGQGEEMDSSPDSVMGSYKPVWMPVEELPQHTVYPTQVAHLVWRFKRYGWPERVRRFIER